MTGFGRSEIVEHNRKVSVEMKSVNHRYLDLNMKMPKKLNFFEANIRNILKDYISRGKVDLFITYEDNTENNVSVKYNENIAKEYVTYLKQMAEDFSIDYDLRASSLSRYPEVLTMQETVVDEEELCQLVQHAIESAAKSFVETRVVEGENLKNDMVSKLDDMLVELQFIEERMPQLVQEYQEKLQAKISELLQDAKVDESRIVTEVTIFADKSCIDEEIVRLRSHIETTRNTLLEGGSVGRKLDFIAQEMNREANTILSKASSLDISNRAIQLKTEIEKIREQIQNIE